MAQAGYSIGDESYRNSMIASNPSVETLASNTGYDSQNRSDSKSPDFTVGIDWLDFTFRQVTGAHEARSLLEEYERVTGKRVDFIATRSVFNGVQWDGSGSGSDGTMIWYKAPWEDEFGEHHPAALKIALPGSAIAAIDTQALGIWLLMAGEGRELDCTRIDIALDDHDKLIKLRKIAEARQKGYFFNCSYSGIITSSNRGEIEGVTIYFGSPASDKRLRIYDKTVESKGKILGNRWEAQFRRKAAYQVFSLWLEAVEKGTEAVRTILQDIVVGVIDFRIRDDDDTDRRRCKRCAWFTRLLEIIRAVPARIRLPEIEQTAQRSINWLKKSVAQTLGTLDILLQDEFPAFVEGLVKSGVTKISNKKWRLIEETDIGELLY